ncbi:hypothetical protein AAC978_11740 [Desulfitobacterium sp. THU1]|uniref:hypothetical protein n=1 Tax=Desulfitobacterium sp. THU1 TaxID=3138072 RepID=UPI00311FC700
MNKLRKISFWMCIILLLFLLSGCAERPFLAKGGIYSIVTMSSEGEVEKTPIQLNWNTNFAVMQQLLLEASFVLGDLHTLPSSETTVITAESVPKHNPVNPKDISSLPKVEDSLPLANKLDTKNDLLGIDMEGIEEIPAISSMIDELPIRPTETVLLEATFPEAKSFELLIDDELTTLDITNVQIEVTGLHPGRVILNQTMFLQGIPNPNLESAFKQFLVMLAKTEQATVR